MIGELQDAITDLRMERSRTSRLGLELERAALERRASDGPLCGSSRTSAPRGYPIGTQETRSVQSVLERERRLATPRDDGDEQLREELGELQDAATDLRILSERGHPAWS